MPEKFERRFAKTLPSLERRQRGGKDVTCIAGYAAVFFDPADPGTEYLLYPGLRERVMPTAFDRCMRERQDIRGLFNHEPDNLLGRCSSGTMRVSVDKRGLRYEIDYDPDDADHQRVMAKMKRGDLTGSSFSFLPTANGQKFSTGRGADDIRELLDVDVFDVGPVSFPAYQATSADVRSIFDAWQQARANKGLAVVIPESEIRRPVLPDLQRMREQLRQVEQERPAPSSLQRKLEQLRRLEYEQKAELVASVEEELRQPANRMYPLSASQMKTYLAVKAARERDPECFL